MSEHEGCYGCGCLARRLATAEKEVMQLRKALESIAKNTCCGSCREAGVFAQAALDGGKGVQGG